MARERDTIMEKTRVFYISCEEPDRSFDDPAIRALRSAGYQPLVLGDGHHPQMGQVWAMAMMPPPQPTAYLDTPNNIRPVPSPSPLLQLLTMPAVVGLIVGAVVMMACGAGLLALGMYL